MLVSGWIQFQFVGVVWEESLSLFDLYVTHKTISFFWESESGWIWLQFPRGVWKFTEQACLIVCQWQLLSLQGESR
jgi:hypothetical protein